MRSAARIGFPILFFVGVASWVVGITVWSVPPRAVLLWAAAIAAALAAAVMSVVALAANRPPLRDIVAVGLGCWIASWLLAAGLIVVVNGAFDRSPQLECNAVIRSRGRASYGVEPAPDCPLQSQSVTCFQTHAQTFFEPGERGLLLYHRGRLGIGWCVGLSRHQPP
jgi:hypothetical protein